jgi:hypothetical protein
MIKITPLRRTIRHLEQRLRMEGETFIIQSPYLRLVLDSQRSDYTVYFSIRLRFYQRLPAGSFTRQSGGEALLR